MCRSEIAVKYGSADVAESIVAAKGSDEEVRRTHVRVNPDMHGVDTPVPLIKKQWLRIVRVGILRVRNKFSNVQRVLSPTVFERISNISERSESFRTS